MTLHIVILVEHYIRYIACRRSSVR